MSINLYIIYGDNHKCDIFVFYDKTRRWGGSSLPLERPVRARSSRSLLPDIHGPIAWPGALPFPPSYCPSLVLTNVDFHDQSLIVFYIMAVLSFSFELFTMYLQYMWSFVQDQCVVCFFQLVNFGVENFFKLEA